MREMGTTMRENPNHNEEKDTLNEG